MSHHVRWSVYHKRGSLVGGRVGGGGKGCVRGREDVDGGGRVDVGSGSSSYTFRGSLSVFCDTRLKR